MARRPVQQELPLPIEVPRFWEAHPRRRGDEKDEVVKHDRPRVCFKSKQRALARVTQANADAIRKAGGLDVEDAGAWGALNARYDLPKGRVRTLRQALWAALGPRDRKNFRGKYCTSDVDYGTLNKSYLMKGKRKLEMPPEAAADPAIQGGLGRAGGLGRTSRVEDDIDDSFDFGVNAGKLARPLRVPSWDTADPKAEGPEVARFDRKRVCFKSKAQALRMVYQENEDAVERAGGLVKNDDVNGFDTLRERNGIPRGKVRNIAQAMWVALKPRKGFRWQDKYCVADFDYEGINASEMIRHLPEQYRFRRPDDLEQDLVTQAGLGDVQGRSRLSLIVGLAAALGLGILARCKIDSGPTK